MSVTFGQILEQMLRERDINLTYLHRQLNNLGVNITYASLYSYYNLTHCPSNEMAKKIVRSQKLSIDDNQLNEILKATRESIKESKKDNDSPSLVVNLKIKPEQIDDKYRNSTYLLKDDIKQRIDELFQGGKKVNRPSKDLDNISSYIAYLIKKDLKDSNFI